MVLKLLIPLTFLHLAISQQYPCDETHPLQRLKRPIYDFSTRILDRASINANGHFVFSPLSSWLQLAALAEGASGETSREIWRVTGHPRNKCFKNKLSKIINKINIGLIKEYSRNSVIVIDDQMAVKKRFINNVKRYYGTKVFLEKFSYPETAARKVNRFIETGTQGIIPEALYGDDFDSTVMLLSDNLYVRSAWKMPFNPSYTNPEAFHSGREGKYIGNVNMMNQIGYFNTTYLPWIKANVLEIPCVSSLSMLLFLPDRDVWIGNFFYDLEQTTLNSIFNIFKAEGAKLVNLKLPRFKVNTTVDNLPELIADMGVKRIFSPNRAEFDNISKYAIYASLMVQTADIKVTEQGVRARAVADSLVNDTNNVKLEFIANRPFAYILVDRKTQFILFGGAYSVPEMI